MKPLIFISLLFCFLLGYSQKNTSVTINGSVVDNFTHEQLFGVKVDILLLPDSSLVTTVKSQQNNLNGRPVSFVQFNIHKPGSYLVCCSREGYEKTYNPLTIKRLYKHETVIQIKEPFVIKKLRRKNEVNLKEVVVTATKVKFYINGDTLVYNADAFNLAEGSMLDALIRQMPGVQLKDGGQIFVNGRYVNSLLINGKDFFNNDRKLMLDNLPSYMVKNIKIYERDDEIHRLAHLPGNAQKEYVMDVRLKREYSIGWIANSEAGSGTDDRYIARLFALRFTPNSRISLFANTNNVNDDSKPGQNGDWSPERLSTGLTKTYNAGFDYNVQQRDNRYQHNGDVRVTYSENQNENQVNSVNFLTGGNTFTRSSGISNSDQFSLTSNHKLTFFPKWEIPIDIKMLFANPYFSYNRSHNQFQSASATFSDDVISHLGKAWVDSIMDPNAGNLLRNYTINRVINKSQNNDHHLKFGSDFGVLFSSLHDNTKSFYLNGKFNYIDSKSYLYDHYLLDYPSQKEMVSDYRNRYDYNKDRGYDYSMIAGAIFQLDKYSSVEPSYRYTKEYNESNRSLYLLQKLNGWGENTQHPLGNLPSVTELLQTLDHENSKTMNDTRLTHEVAAKYHYNSSPNGKETTYQLDITLPMRFERNQLDYKRSVVDTVFHHDVAFFEPSINVNISNSAKQWIAFLHYDYSSTAPTLTNFISLKDNSDPLNTITGSSNLKNKHTNSFNGVFYKNLSGQRMYNINAECNIYQNSLALGYIYNKQTGVRTITPSTVNGNWDAHLKGGYTMPIDKAKKITLSSTTSLDYNHSVDLIGTDTVTGAKRSTVSSFDCEEALKLNYSISPKMNFGLNGNFQYQNSTSGRSDFSTINVFSFNYGLTSQLELPWNMQLSTDLTMYSRRGYADYSMNTNELVWNARLSKRFMKGNLTLMLDGFDILNNLSNVRTTINAQGRVETWNNVTPSYGLFHVIYRLNKKPNKTK